MSSPLEQLRANGYSPAFLKRLRLELIRQLEEEPLTPCPLCDGTGQVEEEECAQCLGAGIE